MLKKKKVKKKVKKSVKKKISKKVVKKKAVTSSIKKRKKRKEKEAVKSIKQKKLSKSLTKTEYWEGVAESVNKVLGEKGTDSLKKELNKKEGRLVLEEIVKFTLSHASDKNGCNIPQLGKVSIKKLPARTVRIPFTDPPKTKKVGKSKKGKFNINKQCKELLGVLPKKK